MDDPNLGSFEWMDTIGDPDRRRPFRAWGGLQPTGPGIEEFVALCRAVNAEPLICIRYRGKTPQDAADEVEYFNGARTTKMGALRARNGHPQPYKVKYWQIGNERAGEQYEADLPNFCKAVRAVDPSVKLLSSFPTDGVLKGSGKLLDYTCPHHYACANLEAEANDFAAIRSMVDQEAPHLKVAVTEWNTTAGDMGLKRERLWDLSNALYCARYHNLMHRNCDLVEIANRSNLTNSFCSGIIQTNAQGLYLTPTYFAQMLYANYSGTRPLRIEPPAPMGEGLDVSATLSENGQTLTLFAINNSTDPITKRLSLPANSGFRPDVEMWTLADSHRAADPLAKNTFQEPNRIAPIRSSIEQRDGILTKTFAELSLTVLRFTKT